MDPTKAQAILQEELSALEAAFTPDLIDAIKTALIILIAFNNTLKEVSK